MPSPTATGVELELASVYQFYTALMPEMDPEFGLGGKLLFAGELDQSGCQLARAANIAGAASLATSADAVAARQAMRDGVIDFVVTSLDEALRILKNEIRKRQPVAVGVTASPQAVTNEMLERGVLPDLLPNAVPVGQPRSPELHLASFVAQGARRIELRPLLPGKTFFTVPIPLGWDRPLAEFDALLLDFLPLDDHPGRRWLRLSPRYLGPRARRIRSLECDVETTSKIADRVGPGIER